MESNKKIYIVNIFLGGRSGETFGPRNREKGVAPHQRCTNELKVTFKALLKFAR